MGSRWAAGCLPPPSPGDASTPGAGGSGQETGRLVQLPVSCRRHGRRQACGDTPGQPAASHRHLSRSGIQSRCRDGVRWAPSGPSSPYPGALAQGPRNEFTRSFHPGLSLLQPPPSQPEDAAPPAHPCLSPTQPLSSPLPPPHSHRPAWPLAGLLPVRDGFILSGG